MSIRTKTFQLASTALIPVWLACSPAAAQEIVPPLTMDDLQCQQDGGMQDYIRDILKANDTGGLTQEERETLNRGSGNYMEDILPLIYKTQSYAAKQAANVVEQDSTGMAYPIVRDEMLCAIRKHGEGRYQDEVNLRMTYRKQVTELMVRHSPDPAADLQIILDSLQYDEHRKQYGFFSEPIDIDFVNELMHIIGNAIPTQLMVSYGHEPVAAENLVSIANFLFERVEQNDPAFTGAATFTVLGRIASSQHEFIPRLHAIAFSDHPQHEAALEGFRNTVVDNILPEPYARLVYDALTSILDNPDSLYTEVFIAEYGIPFLSQGNGETAELAKQRLEQTKRVPTSRPPTPQ